MESRPPHGGLPLRGRRRKRRAALRAATILTQGGDGKIAYAGARGPRGFRPDEFEEAIVEELARNKKAAGSGAGGVLLAALDIDGDGTLSEEEMVRAFLSLRKLDKNKDGQLTPEEMGTE